MSRVAIHQPNFLPWLGYFDKVAKSDLFIFLDDVQLVKTGGSWFNRVKLPNLNEQTDQWLTVPIRKPAGTQRILDAEVVDQRWKLQVLNKIRSIYSNHPHFDEVMDLFQKLFSTATLPLAEWNINFIVSLAGTVGIPAARFLRSSSLKVSSQGTQRLVDLTRMVNGTTYLCGGGSSTYFESELFDGAGLKVEMQNFRDIPYFQLGQSEYLGGLSVVDLLMNCGTSKLSVSSPSLDGHC